MRVGLPACPPRTREGRPGGLPYLDQYLNGWAESPEARGYLETHQTRLVKTLEMTPPGGPCDRILEMGAYLQITPALHTRLGYGEVRGCYYGKLGRTDHRVVTSADGERFECDIDHFDAEKDRFPYADEHFSTVLCCELIEHLFEDPMHLMCEVNRILKPGGHLVLTTPNVAALRGISAILQGYHPGFFHAYIRPAESGEVDARHNREYTPREIHKLLENAGFEVARLETGEFRDEPHPEFGWVRHLLEQLPPGYRPARRRHLRPGAEDRRRCASAIPGGCTHERRLPAAACGSSTRSRGVARAEFELRNDSAETWRADDGFAIGYHLFDADTGTLIVDGARVRLAATSSPARPRR